MRRKTAGLLMPTQLGHSAEETKEYMKLLTPLFTEEGLDVDKLKKIQDKRPHLTAKPDPELTKEYLWRKNSLLQNAKQVSTIQPFMKAADFQVLNIQPIFISVYPSYAGLNLKYWSQRQLGQGLFRLHS
jgi:hypothetical protein